jgi:hypothetical protein
MATVDSDKVVCGGIHAKIVAVLVDFDPRYVYSQPTTETGKTQNWTWTPANGNSTSA